MGGGGINRHEAVVFDFGNVLCRINRAAFSEALAAHCPHDPGTIGRLLWGDDLEKDNETGKIDSRTHHAKVRERIGAADSLDYETFRKAYMLILEPNPDGIEALRYARARGARIFILSNIAFLHATWIFSDENLATIPELHILSYKVGVMKPDPLIWRKLLGYTGLAAEDCLYVDDIEEYCVTARSLGFDVLKYDFRLQNLSRELENVL